MDNNAITIEEHKELGRLLKITRAKLLEGLKKYKTNKDIRNSHENKAQKLISCLKDHLEEIMFRDHGDNFREANTSVYYGDSIIAKNFKS